MYSLIFTPEFVDTGNDLYTTSSNILTIPVSSFTLFIVANIFDIPGDGVDWSWGRLVSFLNPNQSANGDFWGAVAITRIDNYANPFKVCFRINDTDGNSSLSGYNINGNTNFLVTVRAYSNRVEFYVNGTLIESANFNSPMYLNVTKMMVGGLSTTNLDGQNAIAGWRGAINEIGVYESAVSNTDRQSIESYLMTKWSISS